MIRSSAFGLWPAHSRLGGDHFDPSATPHLGTRSGCAQRECLRCYLERLSDLELHLMTKRSSKVGGNKQAKPKKATPSDRAATGSANCEVFRDNASFKAHQEPSNRESEGARDGNTKRPSRVEPSGRDTVPKLATGESTGLPRQIDERVLNQAYLEVPSRRVVRRAESRATHAPKTSFAAGPTKTSPASAEDSVLSP
jgi:hypothetical protein